MSQMAGLTAPSITKFTSRPIWARPLLRLLFVADDRSTRESYRDTAAALGYYATVCESAEQAARLVGSQPVDITFVDVKTRPSTQDVIRTLKMQRPDMEIVVLSADGSVELAVQAIKAGAYEYISKPFSMQHKQDCR